MSAILRELISWLDGEEGPTAGAPWPPEPKSLWATLMREELARAIAVLNEPLPIIVDEREAARRGVRTADPLGIARTPAVGAKQTGIPPGLTPANAGAVREHMNSLSGEEALAIWRSKAGAEMALTVAFWDAANEYAAACGGDTSDKTAGDRRMNAVVALTRAAEERYRSDTQIPVAWLEQQKAETERAAAEIARLTAEAQALRDRLASEHDHAAGRQSCGARGPHAVTCERANDHGSATHWGWCFVTWSGDAETVLAAEPAITELRRTVTALRNGVSNQFSSTRADMPSLQNAFDAQADGIERALSKLESELTQLRRERDTAQGTATSTSRALVRVITERDDARLEAENLRVEVASIRQSLGATEGESTSEAMQRFEGRAAKTLRDIAGIYTAWPGVARSDGFVPRSPGDEAMLVIGTKLSDAEYI